MEPTIETVPVRTGKVWTSIVYPMPEGFDARAAFKHDRRFMGTTAEGAALFTKTHWQRIDAKLWAQQVTQKVEAAIAKASA